MRGGRRRPSWTSKGRKITLGLISVAVVRTRQYMGKIGGSFPIAAAVSASAVDRVTDGKSGGGPPPNENRVVLIWT